jgi:hypothetical protein
MCCLWCPFHFHKECLGLLNCSMSRWLQPTSHSLFFSSLTFLITYQKASKPAWQLRALMDYSYYNISNSNAFPFIPLVCHLLPV